MNELGMIGKKSWLNVARVKLIKGRRDYRSQPTRDKAAGKNLPNGQYFHKRYNKTVLTLSTEGSLTKKRDLLAFYLSVSYCHKTVTRPPCCGTPQQLTMCYQMKHFNVYFGLFFLKNYKQFNYKYPKKLFSHLELAFCTLEMTCL